MKTFRSILIGLSFIALLAPQAFAHKVALKNGQVIQFEKYRVTEYLLLYADSTGKEVKVALNDIDCDRTRDLSANDNPPLDLPGLKFVERPHTSGNSQSLGDVARKNQPKDVQTTTKRVWTSDDFSSAADYDSPDLTPKQEASESETLYRFRLLGKEELGAAVLKMANVPDVDFPGRRDWEEKLFQAKRAWLDQLDRMESHKNSSKDARDTETRLAQGARRNFERVEEEGIQQARAVNDPMLKAHLQYQRQLNFCKQTTGEMLQTCLASLDQLKWQMQREGIW